jgi:hypothetical protein
VKETSYSVRRTILDTALQIEGLKGLAYGLVPVSEQRSGPGPQREMEGFVSALLSSRYFLRFGTS